jgi:hypothetical protein
MPPQSMSSASQIAWATNVDRDDPFMGRRMASHAAAGVPFHADFGRARRQPATIEERFRLTQRRS